MYNFWAKSDRTFIFASCSHGYTDLNELRHDTLSHFFGGLNYGKSVAKPKNNGLLRKKNAKEVILEQKGTRMAEGGKDWTGLEMMILKSLANFFKILKRNMSAWIFGNSEPGKDVTVGSVTNDWMQENHTTSNKTTWLVCCRISCRNSRTRRQLKCKQNKFDTKAGTTARAIETLTGTLVGSV